MHPTKLPEPIYCSTNRRKFLKLRRFVPIGVREESYGKAFWHSKGFAYQFVASLPDENIIEQSPRRQKRHGRSSSLFGGSSAASLTGWALDEEEIKGRVSSVLLALI
jgi:hypothetical protein